MVPTKLELLTAWLPGHAWYLGGEPPVLARAGGFRLDDPAGEVGLDLMAVTDTSGERPVTYQVPLTYRGAPLDGAEDALIGTTEHGVLGTRWVYDGTRDPVLVEQLFAFALGRAEAQAQGVSNTPDPTVTAHFAEPDGLVSASLVRAVDGPSGTDIEILAAPAPGAAGGGAGPRPLVIRFRRVPVDDGAAPAPLDGALGHVTANWLLADGETRGQGPIAVIRDAPAAPAA